jgi:hypothetical protein
LRRTAITCSPLSQAKQTHFEIGMIAAVWTRRAALPQVKPRGLAAFKCHLKIAF